MLRDRDGAADCVQDVFCIAATRLPQLREPDKLRPWLYSIARNEALRRIRERRREEPAEELPDTASGEPGPDTLAARTELADLIADAAGGLSDRDRTVLELAFRHGLDGPELADALGVSPTNANTLVHRLRGTIERSLGALLVSRRVRSTGGCPELAAILDGWDGHFNVLMRKRISRHIESCETCDEERRRLVSPVALLGAPPVFIPAPEWLRERTLSEIQLTSASAPMGEAHGRPNDQGGRSLVMPVTAFIAALIAALGLIFVWLNQKDVSPTDVTETVPASGPAPPPPSVAQPPPPSVAPPHPRRPRNRPSPPRPRLPGAHRWSRRLPRHPLRRR
jgi:RNA polymerase sigma factor (sigma-70 family)